MPQKNPLGNVACSPSPKLLNDERLNCRAGAAAAAVAFEDLLHAENRIPGRPAAAPIPRTDCTNLRRVRRKAKLGLLQRLRWQENDRHNSSGKRAADGSEEIVNLVSLRVLAVVHLPQLVGGRAIDHPARPRICRLSKQQFAPPVAVGVHRVDQLETWCHVKMKLVGHSRI